MSVSVEYRQLCIEMYHRFVNTTPNPSATKNRRGDDVGPLLLFECCVAVAVGAPAVLVVAKPDIAASMLYSS